MKRALNNQYDQLFEKLVGYVSMLNFRYLNMCIKAEPASLIPVKVNIEGTDKNLEQLASTAKKDDYRFWIVPKYDDDIQKICEAVGKVHPEFKQEVSSFKVEGIGENGEGRDVRYIQLTMPEVNDLYHDTLTNAVDVFYQQCKTLMETAIDKAKAEIAFQSVGESKEDVEGIKKAVDKLAEQYEGKRDKLRDDKLKDIEEAYQKWLLKVEG